MRSRGRQNSGWFPTQTLAYALGRSERQRQPHRRCSHLNGRFGACWESSVAVQPPRLLQAFELCLMRHGNQASDLRACIAGHQVVRGAHAAATRSELTALPITNLGAVGMKPLSVSGRHFPTVAFVPAQISDASARREDPKMVP